MEPIPASTVREVAYTMDMLPVWRRAKKNIYIYKNAKYNGFSKPLGNSLVDD